MHLHYDGMQTNRTRSSFASPMHERETMQPHSGNAFNFNDPQYQMQAEYAEKNGSSEGGNGVYRTDTNYTNGSMEKSRGIYADAQSVHSIPPAYTNAGQAHNHHQNYNNYRSEAGDLSGATLLDGNSGLRPSEDGNTANQPVHHMLANVNTGLSSFKPVPPPGSKPAPMPRVEEPSYPPRMQSQNANAMGQERSGTPPSARRGQHQPQQQYNQQQQQYTPRDHQYQQQQQQSYSRNSPSHQQQQYSSHNANNRHVPPSPAYSQSTLASTRNNRYDDDFASPQAFYTPSDRTPTSPNGPLQHPSPAATSAVSGAGHRYRQPPQNRNNRPQSPPINPAAAYQNPYAAFAAEDGNAYHAEPGQGYADHRGDARHQQYRAQQHHHQQQQQQYDAADSYFPAQTRQQPHQQQSYGAAYDSYRQY